MRQPLLYEINTRCWLRELSAREGRPVRLGDVPETEFAFWKRAGFTHVWLMGVWTTGPHSRRRFLEQPDTPRQLRGVLPDWGAEDVAGSPYAIARYEVPGALGGAEGLKRFRERLHAHGLGLVLDFVPNHTALDHPWALEKPERFLQSSASNAEAVLVHTASGPRWLAHGKDPWFPAWNDTLQLDLRRADTRAALLGELRAVAEQCDAVRCDMAMLALNDVFARTWEQSPPTGDTPATEFWAEVIDAVRRPGFLFIAEAYWDLESRLQSLGFDYTYNKRVTDCVVERRWDELQRFLLECDEGFLRRSVHFLENHDEPRIAARLSTSAHQVAALLALSLPGMCLLHEGQLAGARVQQPVQLARRPVFAPDPDVEEIYERLFQVLPLTCVGRGRGRVLRPSPVPPDNEAGRVIAILWQRDQQPSFDLAVINPAPEPVSVAFAGPVPVSARWSCFDWLRGREPVSIHMDGGGLWRLPVLPGESARLLRLEPPA